MEIKIKGKRKLNAKIIIPSDKSISHRSIMIASLANGKSIIKNFLNSEDCLATLDCFRKMGVDIVQNENQIVIKGKNFLLEKSDSILDCKNSGTTARILSGILATQPFESILDGDDSLRKRPMKRVADPLYQMGAQFTFINNEGNLPMKIKGGSLKAIQYQMPVSSAQVKSAIIFAALRAEGITTIIENSKSRDHTERMLTSAGVNINVKFENNQNIIQIEPCEMLYPIDLDVPSDLSSAAFFIVMAIINKHSEIIIENVLLNPTRTGIIEVLKKMGANIEIVNQENKSGEITGTIIAKSSNLKGVIVNPNIIPSMIDEIPILSVAAAFADGTTIIDGIEELRYKESDRIKTICSMLKSFGADVEELQNGLIIHGAKDYKPAVVNSFKDHRIAMSASIFASAIKGESTILDAECVSISYPNFYKTFYENSQEC